MGKSDEYIDYKAYVRYLRKVTGEQADMDKIEARVLACAAEHTEMQTAYALLWKTGVAAAVVVLVAFFASLSGMFLHEPLVDECPGYWEAARLESGERQGMSRLYEAYMFSESVRNKLISE